MNDLLISLGKCKVVDIVYTISRSYKPTAMITHVALFPCGVLFSKSCELLLNYAELSIAKGFVSKTKLGLGFKLGF